MLGPSRKSSRPRVCVTSPLPTNHYEFQLVTPATFLCLQPSGPFPPFPSAITH